MTTATQPEMQQRESLKTAKHQAWWHIALEILLITALGILSLEGLFRVCGVGGSEFLEPDAVLGCHQLAGKQVTWRLEGYSNDRLSLAGRRDILHSLAKPAGVKRIAVLGDSATEGLQVPLTDTYCRVLDHLLNTNSKPAPFEVLNFGCSSYSTGQQVLQFEKDVTAYKPDITVLLYVRGAALQNCYNPYKRAAEPRPYFYMDNKGALQQDNSILIEQATGLKPHAVLDFLRRHSRIYGVFSQANLALSIHEKLYNKMRGWTTSLASKFQPKAASRSTRLFYPQQDVWPVTKALLHRLNKDCQAAGSPLIVMIFPNTIGDPILAVQIADLNSFSKQEGFGLLDLTPAFKANKDPSSLFLQYHFSSAGHKLTAEQLAAFLAIRT